MSNFIFRTEEMTNEQIQEFYVENADDIATVQKLSSRNPVLLVGSRGVGKTFLFRVAQSKLSENFSTKKILPVYITFRKASVIQVKRPIQFQSWMLSRICSNIIKELRKTGFDVRRSYGAKLLLGESKDETIWAEHSGLAEKYTGYRDLITWGRDFVEKEVIPSIKAKNDSYLAEEKPTSVYFWIDRNAPQKVKEALRILEYSGIVYEHSKGIRATRDGIGTRYAINVGCLLSAESTPLNIGLNIVRRITIKRMTEFGANYKSYNLLPDIQEVDMTNVLREHLKLDIRYLDLTPWQIDKIRSVSINTIGELLGADESALMKASYIAGKRARSIKNAAYAAVYEFLLG